MTALPVVSAAGKGLSTIGSFLGRTALKGAKGAASLGLDAAVGTGKLLGKGVSAPFKLFSSDKDDAKKLTPEQDKEGEQKDASEESKEDQKEDREQKSKDSKEQSRSRSIQQTLPGFEPTQQEKLQDQVEKDTAILPALTVINDIKAILNVIKDQVKSIAKSLEFQVRDEKKENVAQFEERIEDEREDKKSKGDSEDGFIKKNIKKATAGGVGGLLSKIFNVAILFFTGRFILKTFFPTIYKPLAEFFNNIGSFFINLKDSVKALFKGDTEGALKELGEAGNDASIIFKKFAKFLSNLLDKILVFMGMDELNAYDKVAKFINETVKPKIDEFITSTKKYFEKMEGQTIGQKIMNVISDAIGSVLDKIASLFTLENIAKIIDRQRQRSAIREDTEDAMEDFTGRYGTLEKETTKARKEALDSGMISNKGSKISNVGAPTFVQLEKAYNDPELRKKMTPGELALYNRITKLRKRLIAEEEKRLKIIEQQRLDDVNNSFGNLSILNTKRENEEKTITGQKLSDIEKSVPGVGEALNNASVNIMGVGGGGRQPVVVNNDNKKTENIMNAPVQKNTTIDNTPVHLMTRNNSAPVLNG